MRRQLRSEEQVPASTFAAYPGAVFTHFYAVQAHVLILKDCFHF